MKDIVPIEPFMSAEIKFFGRYKSGFIRDGVLLAIKDCEPARAAASPLGAWGWDAEWWPSGDRCF